MTDPNSDAARACQHYKERRAGGFWARENIIAFIKSTTASGLYPGEIVEAEKEKFTNKLSIVNLIFDIVDKLSG